MSIAQQIVEVLLDEDRECAACQKELGIVDPPGTSHGYCLRHFQQMHGDMFTPEQIAAMPPEHFARDRGNRQP